MGATEHLTYADLAERLKISAEAARSMARRMHLPRKRANDGKTLIAVDFSEIQHKPMSTPPVRRVDIDTLRSRVAQLEELVARAEAIADRHRADFERERERAERLATELLSLMAEAMAAKEKAARLEGEIAGLQSRPWWRRLAG
jgi:hypothetical protein